MKTFKTTIRVRYCETDKMGVVHHSNYAKYCEIARWEAFRHLGTSCKELEDKGYFFPVISMNFQFVKPALYDDEIKIITKLKELKGAKMFLEYELYNKNNELINKAETTLAVVKQENMLPCKPPLEIKKLFEM